MPAYAYKIKINYNREIITLHHTKELDDGSLTIKELESIVGENTFSICNSESQFSNGYVISWNTYRKETDGEYDSRIKRLEEYNTEVERRRDLFLGDKI